MPTPPRDDASRPISHPISHPVSHPVSFPTPIRAPAAPEPADAADAADAVLAVNAGSSTLKFGLYGRRGQAHLSGQFSGLQPGGTPDRGIEGEIDGVALGPVTVPAGGSAHAAALALLAARMAHAGLRLRAVAHRIVHGGTQHVAPCLLDDAVLAELDTLSPLAPLHQPHNLAGVRVMAQAFAGVPQVGCFDTAFFAGLPELETLLPLPAALRAQGLRRFGFHGLSYTHVVRQFRTHSRRGLGRVLLAHLGSGASVCALHEGRPVATSMGFSALDGLMMGTRSGSLDAGVLLHLLRQGMDVAGLERLLYRESGLRGVSGVSGDLRTLRASDAPDAQRAIALFVHRLLREAGAQTALLGGLDALVFTGGIGEHDAGVRAGLAHGLAHLGVVLDEAANEQAHGDAVRALHAPDSAVELWVVPTDEGRVAASAAFDLIDRIAQPAQIDPTGAQTR